MTVRLALTLFLSCIAALAQAQLNSLNRRLDIHSAQITYNHYQANQDSRGLLIEWQYSLKPDRRQQMTSSPVHISIFHESGLAYRDTSQLIVLRCNQQQRAQIFVPYRLLDLRGNETYDKGRLRLRLRLPQLLEWNCDTLSFTQPERCRIDIDLANAAVKEQLQPWDPSELGPNAQPDPYWAVFLGRSSRPIYTAPTQTDNFSLPPHQTSIFILQSDSLSLQFFDEDGRNDQPIAQIPLPYCTGDATLRRYGEMHQDIKTLSYILQYQQLTQQPIMLYAHQYQHQGTDGVRIDIDYNVSRNFKGELGKINFLFLDDNRQNLEISNIQPLPPYPNAPNSPALDSFTLLSTRARWSYFVPFYAWNNEIRQIAFYMFTPKGQRATATPCLLLKKIQFDQPLRFAQLRTEENAQLDGIKGYKIHIQYDINPNYPTDKMLSLQVKQKNGNTAHTIYQILPQNTAPTLLNTAPNTALIFKDSPHRDSLQLFLPYSSLNAGQISLSAVFGGANPLNIIPDTTLIFKLPPPEKDVKLNVALGGDFSVGGDYGHVVQIAYKMPKFLRKKCQINLTALRNGQPFERYKVHNCDTCRNVMILPQDTGAIQVVFPYRYLAANDSIQLIAWASPLQASQSISDTIRYRGLAPQISTQTYQISPSKLHISTESISKLQPEESYQLAIWLGSQCLINKALPPKPKYNPADLKAYEAVFTAHRDDQLRIYLIHKTPSATETKMLYEGKMADIQKQKGRLQIRPPQPLEALQFVSYPARARNGFARLLFRWGLLK